VEQIICLVKEIHLPLPLAVKSISSKKRQLTLWILPSCAATLQWRIEGIPVLPQPVELPQNTL
jgi:hypothetical protein